MGSTCRPPASSVALGSLLFQAELTEDKQHVIGLLGFLSNMVEGPTHSKNSENGSSYLL